MKSRRRLRPLRRTGRFGLWSCAAPARHFARAATLPTCRLHWLRRRQARPTNLEKTTGGLARSWTLSTPSRRQPDTLNDEWRNGCCYDTDRRLAQRIGLAAARRLGVTGVRIDGAEALAIGVAGFLVRDGAALDTAVRETCNQILKCAPEAIAVT